jgi:tRNA nucleotidyltransferase (CCA-adding enzyme)
LRSGVLRAVGDPEARFTEDALRILRAYRFSAQLGFLIEEKTLAAAKKLAHLTGALSGERVREEIEKILLSPRPELAGELVGADASSLATLPCDRLSRWAALCAKMPSPEAFLRGMRLDNETIRACVNGVRCAEPWDMLAAKRAVAAYGERAARCAEAINGRALGLVDEILESGACCTLKQLAVTGEDLRALGFPPDRTLGARLARLLDYVIENPAENDREKLLILAQNEL